MDCRIAALQSAIAAILQCYDFRVDERDFFNNRNETRTDKLSCPRCKRVNDYQMRWVVRTKKDRIPPGADERDRALYAKLRDYMIRVDDAVTCKTCGKKFDVPSQHSMVFIEKGAGVPGAPKTAAASAQNDDDEDSRFNR
jgi:hypothetical protein